MTTQLDYARHSPYTDPGSYGPQLDALPTDVRELTAVVRNVIVHYRASRVVRDETHLREIDNRWVERILACDQGRFAGPLAEPRPEERRVAGCCRDFTLLTVAALRHQGVPARSRIGFATYFPTPMTDDHVVAEYWDGTRWVRVDAQLEPGSEWQFDPADLPTQAAGGPFQTAAEVWVGYRRGELDAERYGVSDPRQALHGGWFVGNYVLQELAHLQRDELLLWDVWGAMTDGPQRFAAADHTLLDEVAALLLAADTGDEAAERELADRYARDPRLRPEGHVLCMSPTGRTTSVDLATREISEEESVTP